MLLSSFVLSFPVKLWLSLAALCVINEEHADALSSGQWLGQDGLPQSKVIRNTIYLTALKVIVQSVLDAYACMAVSLPLSLCVTITTMGRPRR